MTTRATAKFLFFSLLICLGTARLTRAAGAATNAVDVSAPASGIGVEESLRSYLQIQEQLHNLQAADEKSRQEAEAAAARNNELLNNRLDLIEKSLASQQFDEINQLKRSNETQLQNAADKTRIVLVASGAFAAFGFLVLLLAAFVQWTVVNRVAAVAARLSPDPSDAGQLALGLGETKLLAGPAAQQSAGHLLEVIGRLEKRIRSMETAVQAHETMPEINGASSVNGETNGAGLMNGDANGADHILPETPAAEVPPPEKSGVVTLLLGKGQTLLRLDKPDAAIMCFDEILALDPKNTDALVKKGAALERLEKLEEALACFDRAIAADGSMTMAYLHKGGVFNRMERYAEALECYEQALRTQEKNRASSVAE